jgi:hypothetical protein
MGSCPNEYQQCPAKQVCLKVPTEFLKNPNSTKRYLDRSCPITAIDIQDDESSQ